MNSNPRSRSRWIGAFGVATALGVAAMACAPALVRAQPGVPDVSHSTVPSYIKLGGAQTPDGTPDPSIAFTITCRDFVNNPIVGGHLHVDFAGCSDLALCTAVVAGQEVDCAFRAVRGVTDANGQVRLSILGAGINSGTTVPPAIAPGSGTGCIRVYVDGVLISASTAVLYDQNGALPGGNGVNGLDFAVAKNDVGAIGLGAPYRGRSDYTQDGTVSGADLAQLRNVVGLSGLGQGSAAGCASGGVAQPYCP